MNLRSLGIIALGMSALLGVSGGAEAAPQALALVSTGGDITLACKGGECSAEMSSFCLQPNRIGPVRGTKYNLVDGSDIILKGETADGREVILDSGKYLRFASERTHVAMLVSVSAEAMAALGIEKIKLNVGENVALLPEPVPGDDRPQLEADLLVLTGSLRTLGTRLVDFNRQHMVGARLTSRMINEMPLHGQIGEAESERLWQSAFQSARDQNLPEEGIGMARRAVEFCNFAAQNRVMSSMRRCLQSEHDDMLEILNSNYWQAVKTGS